MKRNSRGVVDGETVFKVKISKDNLKDVNKESVSSADDRFTITLGNEETFSKKYKVNLDEQPVKLNNRYYANIYNF